MAGDAIPIKRKLGYSVGHAFNDLTASMWYTYLIAYFHEVKNFNDTLAGTLMMIGQSVDAVLTPMVGLASDNSKSGCCKIGRRKSWHLIGTICSCLGFPFIFIPCWFCVGVPDWAQFIYYVPLIVIFQFGWACAQIGHLALIPEMTFSTSEKVQLNGWRYAITVLCHMLVYLLAWLFFDAHRAEEASTYLNAEDGEIFRDLAICVVVIGIICSCVFYCLVHEKDNPIPGDGFGNDQKNVKKEIVKNEEQILKDEATNKKANAKNPYLVESKTDETKPRSPKTNFMGIFKSNSSDKICKTHDTVERKLSSMSCPESDVIARISSISSPENDIEMSTIQNRTFSTIPGILKSESKIRTIGNPKKRISFVSSQSEIELRDRGCNDVVKPNMKLHKHWKEWFKEPSFYQMALIYMCTRLTVNISQIYMPMYITETLHMHKDSVALVPLVGYVAGFCTSLFMNNTNRLLGRKRTYFVGISCTLGACVWIFFIDEATSSRVYGVAALSGIGGSTVLVTSLAMTSDLIDQYSNSAAFVYGAMSFTEKLANGLAVVLIQRYNPCENGAAAHMTHHCTVYYRDVLVTVPGGVTFISLLVLLSTMSSIGGRSGWKEHRILRPSSPDRDWDRNHL
uniref:Major facilitator superfamily domain-containing protein 12-like n=1 Tax=Crassostrea virginica TaxID=6565 RepID=A0A8B8DN05_CRAVI|nr:major facilitator superfamily domain-containing protein 12-like [Crassostrea virginica]